MNSDGISKFIFVFLSGGNTQRKQETLMNVNWCGVIGPPISGVIADTLNR